MLKSKALISVIKRILYFGLPVVLLSIIFTKIDFQQLWLILKNANPYLILLGIILKPMMIVIGSFRWHSMSSFYGQQKLSFSFYAYHYWAGLAIGYFTPGNLGWDAYRILTVGKQIKSYSSSIITIIAEKFTGLFSVLTMTLIMFPLIANQILENQELYTKAYYFGLLAVFSLILILVFLNRFQGNKVYKRIQVFIGKIIQGFSKRLNLSNTYNKVSTDLNLSRNLFSIFNFPSVFLKNFSLSLLILVVASVCSQFIFQGLGYQLNFTINLFAAPVFFLLFLIPISFGSIGVREGAFILVYGLFGVPKEVALLVSFLNLFGLFLNNIIGALVIFSKGLKSFKAIEIRENTP